MGAEHWQGGRAPPTCVQVGIVYSYIPSYRVHPQQPCASSAQHVQPPLVQLPLVQPPLVQASGASPYGTCYADRLRAAQLMAKGKRRYRV